MTDLIALPTLTAKGFEALTTLLLTMKFVEDPADRREAADAILADPELAVPHASGIVIDKAARFATAMEFCDEIHPRLAALGVSGMMDPGINAALTVVYIDQLVGKKAKKPESYLLRRKGQGLARKNYRNSVYVFANFYMEHQRTPGSTAALLLNTCAAHELTFPMEKLAQQPGLMASPSVLDLVGLAMLNDKGKFVRPPKKDTGGVLIKAEKALQEMSVVLTQAGKNYDISEMVAAQLVALMPESLRLAFYKMRAKKALTARNRAVRSAFAS